MTESQFSLTPEQMDEIHQDFQTEHDDETEECRACQGRGYFRGNTWALPENSYPDEDCIECDGTGLVPVEQEPWPEDEEDPEVAVVMPVMLEPKEFPQGIIRPFADGVIISHPDNTRCDMISLEKSGAYLLCETVINQITLPELSQVLIAWFRGYHYGPISGWINATHLIDPINNFQYVEISESKINVCQMIDLNLYGKVIGIPEAAEILKEWYADDL